MKTVRAVIHPIAFQEIKKGDVITRNQIEAITGERKATSESRYNFAKMALKQRIERERPDLYLRGSSDDLVIMTDEQAEEYNRDRIGQHVENLGRDARRRVRIDRSEFSPEAARAAESRDRSYQGVALLAKRALIRAERDAELMAPEEPKKLP